MDDGCVCGYCNILMQPYIWTKFQTNLLDKTLQNNPFYCYYLNPICIILQRNYKKIMNPVKGNYESNMFGQHVAYALQILIKF